MGSLCLTTMFLTLCVLACVSSPSICEEDILDTEFQQSLAAAVADFTQSIYAHLASSFKQDNFVFSPLSLHSALSLLYLATKDNSTTQEQLGAAMGIVNSQELLKTAYNGIINSYRNQNSFLYGNHIWVGRDLYLDEQFESVVINDFNSGVSKVDFKRREAVTEVNRWIKETTKNKIQKMVESFSADTEMFIANALYFKEDWLIPFNELNYEGEQLMADFETASGKLKVPALWQESDRFGYGEIKTKHNIKLGLVTIPYKNEMFQMQIIIPESANHLGIIEHMMKQNEQRDQSFDFLKNGFNLFKDLTNIYDEETQDISLTLPKFNVKNKFNAVDALKNLGAREMFMTGADLDKILAGGPVAVEDILHQAGVEVDKDGTEGYAATGIEVSLLSLGTQKEVFVDKPFIFIIQDKENNIPVLAGRITNPLITNP